MNCKIQVITTGRAYFIYVAYINDDEFIHKDLIERYDVDLHSNAVEKVVKHVFKYKSFGIDVEINKERNINNMYNFDRLMKALEF